MPVVKKSWKLNIFNFLKFDFFTAKKCHGPLLDGAHMQLPPLPMLIMPLNELPKRRHPPPRYPGAAELYSASAAKEHRLTVFYLLLDVTIAQIYSVGLHM